MPLDGSDGFAGRHGPNADKLVAAPRQDMMSVRRKSDRIDPVRLRVKSSEEEPCRYVPQSQQIVLTGGERSAAVF